MGKEEVMGKKKERDGAGKKSVQPEARVCFAG